MAIGIVFCAHLLFLLINTLNASDVYGTPLIQSMPRPFTSYEVIRIGDVVSHPQMHNLRLVRLKGIVTALRTIPRRIGMVPPEAHTFTLTDDTGTIEIFYTGSNGYLGPLKSELLIEGDMIEVLVHISYITSPGSEEVALAANLRWVERPQD